METKWKDAKNPPEPGKPVFVVVGKLVLKACWIPKYWHEDDGNYEGDSEYCEEKDEYYWPEGWYEWNYYEDVHYSISDEVTHWMELPKLP